VIVNIMFLFDFLVIQKSGQYDFRCAI